MRSNEQKSRWLSTRLPSAAKRRIAILTGARQTGKTTLAKLLYPKLHYLNLDAMEQREAVRSLRSANWARDVGEAVIDEAQKEPAVFDKVKFAFDEGVIFIDGAASPNEVSNEDRAAECTIAMALDDFASMIEGELDPTTAFMMGKLKVDGPMAIALKLSGLI